MLKLVWLWKVTVTEKILNLNNNFSIIWLSRLQDSEVLSLWKCLADLGKAKATLQTPLLLIKKILRVSVTLLLACLNGAAKPKLLNIKIKIKSYNRLCWTGLGHQNCIIGSKLTAILINGLILPIGGVASGRVCACTLQPAQQACWLRNSLTMKISSLWK